MRCSRQRSTPKPVVDKLADALDKALDDPAVRKRLLDLGSDIPGKDRRGPQALGTLVKSEIEMGADPEGRCAQLTEAWNSRRRERQIAINF